jgi:hypothetical protein
MTPQTPINIEDFCIVMIAEEAVMKVCFLEDAYLLGARIPCPPRHKKMTGPGKLQVKR